MSTPDARWFWADAALEWLEALEDTTDPAAVTRTLDLASASPRGRPLPPGLAAAAQMAAELLAAQRGAPALHLPRAAWRWLERHGDVLDRGALSSAQRAVRRLVAEHEPASIVDDDDEGAVSHAALLNLERRLRAADRRPPIDGATHAAPAEQPAPQPAVMSVETGADLPAGRPSPELEQRQLAFSWAEAERLCGNGWPETAPPPVDAPRPRSVRGSGRRKRQEDGSVQLRLVPEDLSEVGAS
jgi:hypothetical protein